MRASIHTRLERLEHQFSSRERAHQAELGLLEELMASSDLDLQEEEESEPTSNEQASS